MILIIDNYDSFTYNLYHYVLNCGQVCQVIEYHHIDLILSTIMSEDCTGVIISPGPHHPDDYPFHSNYIELAIAKNIPVLGICLGMQYLAIYFEQEVILANKPIHGKSDRIMIFNHETIYDSLPKFINVGRYHSLQVKLNSQKVLISTAISMSDDAIMSIKHLSLNLIGIQYHPESILSPLGQQIISNWLKLV